LLDDTDLPVSQVAFAAGFGSLRQFNRVCHEVFRESPSALRARRRRADRQAADGGLVLRLPYNGPLDWPALLDYFSGRAITGVESVSGDTYRRTIVVGDAPGVLELRLGGDDHLLLRAHLPHWEELVHVVQRARHIASLDLDLEEAVRSLARDALIGPLVRGRPGLRTPGTWSPFEVGVRAIIGQQVSVAAANTVAGRLVEQLGTRVPGLEPLGLTHTFPSATTLAGADYGGVGLMPARTNAIRSFANAVLEDRVRLDGSVTLEQLVASLAALDGLGPWTAHYVALRLGEPDAFPATDLGLQRAFSPLAPHEQLAEAAERWRPWRALAAVHLWTTTRRRHGRHHRVDRAQRPVHRGLQAGLVGAPGADSLA
jgi:AraC family transcriptional regulator of adaptative response / DNA-3-methyladenine glycosylase II